MNEEQAIGIVSLLHRFEPVVMLPPVRMLPVRLEKAALGQVRSPARVKVLVASVMQPKAV
jgi:hypothetical protein